MAYYDISVPMILHFVGIISININILNFRIGASSVGAEFVSNKPWEIDHVYLDHDTPRASPVFTIGGMLGIINVPGVETVFHWSECGGAINMAIEKARRDGILRDANIRLLITSEACYPAKVGGNAVAMYEEEELDVLIGAGCSVGAQYLGYLATFWNTPLISPGATDPAMDHPFYYNTLIRLLPAYVKVAYTVLELAKHYGWKRLAIVSDDLVPCSFSTTSVFQESPKWNLTVATWVKFKRDPPVEEIDKALKLIERKARIIYLCGYDETELHFLLRARVHQMTSSEYVYISPTYVTMRFILEPWTQKLWPEDDVQSAMEAFYQIALTGVRGESAEAFVEEAQRRMIEEPWYYNGTHKVGPYAAFIHDSFYLYFLALNKTRELGMDLLNGTNFVEIAKTLAFEGASSRVAFDEYRTRLPTHQLWRTSQESRTSIHWATVKQHMPKGEQFQLLDDNVWRTVDGSAPPDTPQCGFYGELCAQTDNNGGGLVLAIVLPALFVILTASLITLILRHRRSARAIDQTYWRIPYADLTFVKRGRRAYFCESAMVGGGSLSHSGILSRVTSERTLPTITSDVTVQFGNVAIYRASLVTLKRVRYLRTGEFTHEDRKELKQLRDLLHDNINTFLGVCTDRRLTCLVMAYCRHGTLQKVLGDDDIMLDEVFNESFIRDLIQGVHYLHNSPLKSHGSLKSSNCLVDSHWVLCITDIIPTCFENEDTGQAGENEIYQAMLWTAPEALRQKSVGHSPQADIYSVGIILQEIIFRSPPFFLDMSLITPKEIIQQVKRTDSIHVYRPQWNEPPNCKSGLLDMMTSCWAENPNERPTINELNSTAQNVIGKRLDALVDNIVDKLERYSAQLEDRVAEKTRELYEEKGKTDTLLYQMLPRPIAERLKQGLVVDPEIYEEITAFFSNILDFKDLTADLTPFKIVRMLNDVYIMMDDIVKKYDVYKVETINDSYLVTSGLPNRNGHGHVTNIADMALDILTESMNFRIFEIPDWVLKLRIGIHTGPCCAAVVGLSMPRYCVFGDTINTASRMESHGEGMRIHISESTQTALCAFTDYIFTERGVIHIKGKGKQTTYWLEGSQQFMI